MDFTRVARKINGERVVVLGWGRAILLQLAHPLVAAGIAEHSTFTAGRFARLGRLHATVGAMLDMTFGDERTASRAAARINAIHDRVNGTLLERAGGYDAGAPYTATDPQLLQWVHATLLESMPMAYEQFVGPLGEWEKDAYCEESNAGASRLRIPETHWIGSRAELDRYMRAMMAGPRIAVTAAARNVAHGLLYPPLLDPTRPAAWLTRLMALGMLPPAIRAQYGFGWTAGHARAFALVSRIVRSARRIVPAGIARWDGGRSRPAVRMGGQS